MKKTVLITGANKGIGYETAKQLLAKGYSVYVGSRDGAKGQAAVEQLAAAGFADVEALEIDVTNADSVQQAAAVLSGKVSGLDVLINNAGIAGKASPNTTASQSSMDDIRNVFDTNFFGTIQTTQAFLPLLKKSSAPRIINVSSDLGSLENLSNPNWQYAPLKPLAYSASKAALNMFTVILAYEFKDANFSINSVNPGSTATDLNGHRGQQSVEEGAATVVKYVTLENDVPTGRFLRAGGDEPW